jgi:feruloyl esterase
MAGTNPDRAVGYERVQKQMGGAAEVAKSARLFLVPGVDHGFRGPGATPNINRLLFSLIGWVEEGKAPDQLLAEARDAEELRRAHAHWEMMSPVQH